jgi:hypothetical protein
MNKKAQENKLMFNNTVFLLMVIAFLIIMSAFVYSKTSSAPFWGEFYAKEISKVINYAKPGDVVTLNINKGAAIALKNHIPENEMFFFNNLKKEVCVKLDSSNRYCYSYFNNVDIIEQRISWGKPVNLISFKVRESAK